MLSHGYTKIHEMDPILSNISDEEIVLIVEVMVDTLHGRYFQRCLLFGQFHIIRPDAAEHSDSHKVDDFDETNDGRTEAQTERTANIRYTHTTATYANINYNTARLK